MKSIFAAIFSFALTLAGCVDPVSTAETNQAVLATVTVPIPVDSPLEYANPNVPVPPPWGFYSNSDFQNDFYFPVLIPVGATLTHIRARVYGDQFARCELTLWKMNDWLNVPATPFASMTANAPNGPVTVESDTSVTPGSLQKLFVTMHSGTMNGVAHQPCAIVAAEATYTPPA